MQSVSILCIYSVLFRTTLGSWLRTQPWGSPVLAVSVGDVVEPTGATCGLRKLLYVFDDHLVLLYGVESRAEVSEETVQRRFCQSFRVNQAAEAERRAGRQWHSYSPSWPCRQHS